VKKITYYVASSLDGFISGENEDISGFIADGNGVEQYMNDLKEFETVIMGRKTYEFGYKFGLKPGAPAYPHMNHYIFSNNLYFNDPSVQVQIKKLDIEEINKIKASSTTDIYLCGGGQFAAWLIEYEAIDFLKLKVNPFILGKGIKLFGTSEKTFQLELIESKSYEKGLLINLYKVKY
jgi:dihydrofolate reductase